MRRFLLSLLCASLLVSPAGATWSIVVVNRRTGEVAIGAATCISQTNLTRGLPAIVNGVGGGVIQASGSSTDQPPMVAGMRAGLSPAELLEIVKQVEPSVGQLQTGIVTMDGTPVTFTGTGVGRAKRGVVGEVGDLAYAIQGNVLAGRAVVDVAERALLQTEGDLGQKLLASMIAAREWGGDGRCSCTMENFGKDADDCGSPPDSFSKSAHVGFLLLARQGDPDAPCVTNAGIDCANQPYHMRLVIRGANAQIQDPDPVDQLVIRYDQWRADRSGRPDGILSRTTEAQPMLADGMTRQVIGVQLIDLEGNALTHGKARLEVVPTGDTHVLTRIQEIENHGDGTYSITVVSAARPTTETFMIRAIDDLVEATLYPFLELESISSQPLHIGATALSAGADADVSLDLNVPEQAGASYVVLGSIASGGVIPLASGLILPLSADDVFAFTVTEAGHPEYLPGTIGALDNNGRAKASFRPPAGALAELVGQRLEWVGVVSGASMQLTNVVGIDILP